jgi:phospholipid-binding lipoprotein MlaA
MIENMIKKTLFSLVLISLFFGGCSKNQNINNPSMVQTTQNIAQANNLTEDEEEFEDEELTEDEDLQSNASDPLSGYNIAMTNFNDKFYFYIIKPIAKGYKVVMPKKARTCVQNFFHNLLFPIRFVNNILQGKIKNATEETGRFLVNSTVGVFGLFDVASDINWEKHDEDFGQTLGYWGVGSGYHIVLPFFGPSNIRDLVGFYPDAVVSPLTHNENRFYDVTSSDKEALGATIFKTVNKTSLSLGKYEVLKKDSINLYPYLKNIYEQHRDQLIKE